MVVHLSVAWLAVLLGMLCNAMVTVANDGVMPVKGLPSGFKPLFPTWIPARPANHLVVLGDQQSLFFFSIGDVLITSGALLWRGAGALRMSMFAQLVNQSLRGASVERWISEGR